MSASLGTGNIVGVAVAVTVGGPGAMFWLLISAIPCLAIKYSEGVLSIKYRTIGTNGKVSGGPMYYIGNGVKNKALAKTYAFCGAVTAIVGTGTLPQSNSIAAAVDFFGIPPLATALILSAIVATITLGGIHRISSVAEKIVPAMTCCYLGAGILVLILKFHMIPHALYMTMVGAFSPSAILGAGAGATVMTAIHMGISRGIFSHESGLGSAAIASAAAKTDSAVKQGLISMVGACLTVAVCLMTGLVLTITSDSTGIFSLARTLEGNVVTSYAFGAGLGIVDLGKYVVNLGIIFFAFTTIIGWDYYGEKCIQYLLGDKSVIPYKILFIFFVAIGPFLKIDTIFIIADIMIAFMVIPNLIGLIALRRTIIKETKAFFQTENEES
jgi:AGCS family alanine or glycine:cation symporter